MTELQYFRHTKLSSSFYLAPIGLTGAISQFSLKSFKSQPMRTDHFSDFYPTKKCILEPLILPQRFYLLNQQDLIFSPIQSRDMIIFKRLFLSSTDMRRVGRQQATFVLKPEKISGTASSLRSL